MTISEYELRLFQILKPLAQRDPPVKVYKNTRDTDFNSQDEDYIVYSVGVSNVPRLYGDGKVILRRCACDITVSERGECTGNHDACDKMIAFDRLIPYTGHGLYYTFTQGSDVFIMFGTQYYDNSGTVYKPFSQESLQWLYEVLEANRNKHVFLFQHYLRFDGSGKPYSPWPTAKMLELCNEGKAFMALTEHYKNVIWFHGHSHTKFECQEDTSYANYDRMFGCHSVHIPSLAVPRDYENDAYVVKYSESEGYVVDVYENHIILRGRDFVKGEFLPIAQYCLDTTLQTIAPNTFTDSTGTIIT